MIIFLYSILLVVCFIARHFEYERELYRQREDWMAYLLGKKLESGK